MKTQPNFAVTVRGIIIDKGQLLMVKHQPDHAYHALPGGRLEIGEGLRDGLTRELIEEMNVRPDVGPLLFINEWIGTTNHRVEFFFWVNNATDFRQADPAHSTHGFELAEIVFGDATDPKYNLLPRFLQQRFPHILKLGDRYPTEMVQSTN